MAIKVCLEDFDPEKIAQSGQCFRMRQSGGAWQLIAGNRALQITPVEKQVFEFSCSPKEFDGLWRSYFDLDADYNVYRAQIDPGDGFLHSAAAYGYGIRILRQELWETTVSFIISQRKSIPAIRTCVEALCDRYGEPVAAPWGMENAFPAAKRLAAETSLEGCALGYREKYVLAAARRFACGEFSQERLCALEPDKARAELETLCGVGRKVANCVMLFSLHDINAFPVDVWISRVIDENYAGSFTPPPFGGVIQQYMFYYARSAAYRASRSGFPRKPGSSGQAASGRAASGRAASG